MAEAAKAGAGGTDKADDGKKLGKILGLVFAIVNLAVLGGGAFLVYKSTLGWDPPIFTDEMAKAEMETHSEELNKLPFVYTLEPFKANLNEGPVRGIEIEVSVELANRDGYQELVDPDHMALARDRIISLLQGKTYDEVESVQGKLFLKDEIATSLNAILDKGIVKNIYFSEFKVE